MEEFENKLVALFNAEQLPLEAKRYVVLAFFRNVEDAYQRAKSAEKSKEVKKEDEQMS